MRWSLAIAFLGVAACSRSETQNLAAPEGPLRFDRTLARVNCMTQVGLAKAPCTTYSAASHADYLDSGRVVFRSDGTVQWMLGTHTYRCPCYLGGPCTTPCFHDAPRVSKQSGTYTVAGDSIVLFFTDGNPTTRVLKTVAFPSTATGYAGPDSLVLVGAACTECVAWYPVVFKSS